MMNTPYTSENSRTRIADRVRKTSGIDFSGIKKGSAMILILLSVLLNQQTTYSQTYSAYQAGNQTTYGVNEWIGYVYTNDSWTGYMGYYTATPNFSINWGSGGPGPFGGTSMTDNDYFQVKYKMTKTFEAGLYSIAIQADDCAALSSDGEQSWNLFFDWACSSGVVNTTLPNVELSGSTNLVFAYKECEGGASAGITFTQTCQVPGSPQNPTGTGTGLTTATLSWNAGSPIGTNTTYAYTLFTAADVYVTYGTTTNTSVNITGLLANTQYYFKVRSAPECWSNNWNAFAYSPDFYTGIIPGTPTSLTTTAIGTTTATLNWAAGSPVGNPAPTYYWVLKNAGGTTFTSGNTTGFTVSVGGLTTNTSYYFTVYASNNVGTSAIATSANMATLPVTPTSVTATPSTIAVGNSSNLNATSAGNTIDWYTASSGGTTLGSIASGSNFAVAPASTTTYYAEAVGQATNASELDILPGGTSWGYQYGTMFNVTAINGNRAVTGFRDDIFQEVGNLKVYYKTGSYSGYETNASAWTYLGQYTSSLFTDIPDITIPSGSTYAFYIYVEGSSILKSTSTGTTSDSRLSVTTGSLTSSLFGGVSSGSLYGTVYYGDRGAASTARTSVGLTVVQAPTLQASGISFSSVSARQMTASWTNGNSTSRAVFIKAASSGNAAPVNGTAYTANTAFGSGTQIASTGWYCVYNGTGSSVTVTGLTPNTAYQVHVCEYSGSTGNQAYNVATASNNPKSQTSGIPTISSFTPTSASTGTSVVITGTDLTGATAVSFGGIPAISFTVNSATQITAIVGGGTTGSVGITTPEVTVSLAGFTFTLPAPPTGVTATPSTITVGNSSNLKATSAGNTINWYTASTGGTSLGSSASGANYSVTPATSTTYYAETLKPITGNTDLPLATSVFTGATGAMFNVTTLSLAKIITGFSFAPNISGVQQIKVYYKTGTYVGFQTNSAAWTYLGQFNSDGQAGTSLLDITDVSIPASTTYAFYLNSNSMGGLQFENGAATYTDGSLSVACGSMLNSLFTGNYDNYAWRGTVKHAIPSQTSATRTSVGVTVTQTPATQASNVAFASTNTNMTTVTWTNAAGSSRAVFILAGSTGSALPVNGTTYAPAASYLFGSQIGSSGWYCIYNGTGTSVTVNNLSPATTYRVMVTEYNGSAGGEMYNTSTATLNPNNVTTLGGPTISSFTPTSGGTGMSVVITGTYLTGATAVRFGGIAASSFTVNSATQITAVVAAGSTGSVSVTTPLGIATSAGFTYIATPSTQATNIVFSSVQLTQMTIGWTNGNGANKAVFMKVASSGSASPVNGTAYTSSTTFGSGTQIGTSLWYCIYNGTGSSTVTVTALAASTTYLVHVCEYNGNSGGQMYNTTSSTNNPKSQATATPTISTSGTLTAFSSCAGTASAYQSFSASGSNLTANITVTAPTGFGVCLTSDGTYASTVTLIKSGVSVASTPVYVRMTAAATGSPSGNVALSSSGATTVNVSASGTVSQSPATAAAGDDQTNCNSGTFTLAGNNPSAGTGAWSIVSGTVTITTPSAYNSGVTGIPAGTSATLMWTISNSPCTASTDNVVLTNNELPGVASITGTNTLAVGTTSTLSCVTAGGSWSSSATGVATVNAGVVSGVSAGTATISYTVTDGNGCSDASTKPVTVGKGDQTISFTLVSPQDYGVSPITLNGTATSGLTVSYTSSNTNVATISGNTLSIVGIGSATITASQAGNVNYNAAANVNQTLTVNATGLTWIGATSTNWSTAANWSPATVPTAGYDVTIPAGVTYFPLVSSDASSPAICNNLTIDNGAAITIDNGKALTVNGILSNNSEASGLIINSGGSLIEHSGAEAAVNVDIPANEWHLISSPSSNILAATFEGSYLQKHTESLNAYTDITSVNEALTPMRGYALWGGEAGTTTETFSGLLNAGDQSFSTTAVTYTTGPPVDGGWNLVGNPYPSSIDWQASSGWTKTGINNAIYIHISSSSWAAFVNGVGTPSDKATRYIAPCQGFFVQATAAGELAMTDAVRVHNTTEYFKNSEIVPNLIRLEVSGNGYKDETVVRFVDEATAEFDGNYDAHKLFGEVAAAAQVYTTGTGQLSINSLPETNMVPVGVKIGSTGTYTIAATEINDMPYATLEDTKTGIFTELAKGPYTFNFTSGEDELRFKLHFSALSVNEDEASGISIYSYHKTAYINLKNQLKGDIYICNMAGQLITSRETATGLVSLGINAPGIYIVKVVSDKETTTAKIFIQ